MEIVPIVDVVVEEELPKVPEFNEMMWGGGGHGQQGWGGGMVSDCIDNLSFEKLKIEL